jgi:uncharacterized protein
MVTRALAGLLVVVTVGCQTAAEQPRVRHLRIATGPPGAGFFLLTGGLARFYGTALPGLTVSVESLGATAVNLRALQSNAVDLAIAPADVAYAAYARGTAVHAQPHSNLRGIAALATSQLHILVRSDGPTSLAELEGRNIGYRVPGWDDVSYMDMAVAGGLWAPHRVRATGMSLDDLRDALVAGRIDAALTFSSYPSAPIRELARKLPIRLLEVDPDAAMRIRARYPFYKAVIIPPHPYDSRQQGVRTVGVEVLMLGRRGLDEDLVYRLTKALVEGQSRIAAEFWGPLAVDPEVSPATPVPIHSGAARYFRERELLH